MNNLKLSAPWVTYVNELRAMFAGDKDVSIEYSDSVEDHVKIYVDDPEKANALMYLIPVAKVFGNFILKVSVIPTNLHIADVTNLLETAFKNNSAVKSVSTLPSPFGEFNYITFAKEVVQFPNDEVSDPNGLKSTLYQDIAKDLFDSHPNVFYCTSKE